MNEKKVKVKEEKFLRELNFFRNETESLVRYVYCSGALKDVIINKKSVEKAVNKNPDFWSSVLFSFTDSMFIVLGRIFDMDNSKGEKNTIHTLFRQVDESKEIFSKELFSNRWTESHTQMLDYKDKYMEGFYEMSRDDWKKVKKLKSSLYKQYEEFYKPIRNIIAHKILTDNEQIKIIMDKVPVRDMEKFCTKLRNIHEGLWQLYHNGRGPIVPLKTGKYSSKSFVNKKYEPYHPGAIAYQYSQDAKDALILLAKGNINTAQRPSK